VGDVGAASLEADGLDGDGPDEAEDDMWRNAPKRADASPERMGDADRPRSRSL
jgi:hypothetical protein